MYLPSYHHSTILLRAGIGTITIRAVISLRDRGLSSVMLSLTRIPGGAILFHSYPIGCSVRVEPILDFSEAEKWTWVLIDQHNSSRTNRRCSLQAVGLKWLPMEKEPISSHKGLWWSCVVSLILFVVFAWLQVSKSDLPPEYVPREM